MDEQQPHIRAFAVIDGIITATSHDADGLTSLEDINTRVLTIPSGQTVLPGFGDVHLHLLLAGHRITHELEIQLDWNTQQILAAVEQYAATADPQRWIEGGWWSMLEMDVLNNPDMLAQFDKASRGIPMLLRDESAHNRYVNTSALRLMGINPDNASEYSPEVIVDAQGRATGMLVESASRWAEETMERTTKRYPDEVATSLEAAIASMNERGFTLVQDCGTGENMMEALHALDAEHRLNSWVVTSASINDKIFGFTPIGEELIHRSKNYQGTRLYTTFSKIFEDGIPTSHTAFVHEAYLPDENFGEAWHGSANFSADELVSWMALLSQEHMGVTIHCTGDASVTRVLDAVELAEQQGIRVPVHIAHGEFIQQSDYQRMRDHAVTLDISPQLWYPSSFQEGAFGNMREDIRNSACLFRDQIDAGILLAGGSDWPCSPDPSAWFGIHGLVTRSNPHGNYPGAVYRADQAITLDEAIAAFTINVARATGLEQRTGSISVGKSADFQIAPNPYTCPTDEIRNITTTATYIAGEAVYQR
ncbi:amidohydrolase [Bifidobacterium aquikefiricola]|uniref:Amidohydrolase family protein n=2 Tax=Bifidobacterium TaxID=1678 RepID=A0AB39U8P1_9BIFI